MKCSPLSFQRNTSTFPYTYTKTKTSPPGVVKHLLSETFGAAHGAPHPSSTITVVLQQPPFLPLTLEQQALFLLPYSCNQRPPPVTVRVLFLRIGSVLLCWVSVVQVASAVPVNPSSFRAPLCTKPSKSAVRCRYYPLCSQPLRPFYD